MADRPRAGRRPTVGARACSGTARAQLCGQPSAVHRRGRAWPRRPWLCRTVRLGPSPLVSAGSGGAVTSDQLCMLAGRDVARWSRARMQHRWITGGRATNGGARACPDRRAAPAEPADAGGRRSLRDARCVLDRQLRQRAARRRQRAGPAHLTCQPVAAGPDRAPGCCRSAPPTRAHCVIGGVARSALAYDLDADWCRPSPGANHSGRDRGRLRHMIIPAAASRLRRCRRAKRRG